MRRFLILSAVGVAFLVGCKDSTKPQAAPPSMAGHWVGTFSAGSSVSLDITLSVSGQTLNGSGTITGGGRSTPLTATGLYIEPSVTLGLAITGYAAATITGTCNAAETEITGTISGSGFSGQAVTLDKE